MKFDSNLGLPSLPIDIAYNATATHYINILMGIMALAAFVYSIREYIKTKSFIPLALSIGSIFICITEVFVDIMGCVYYPTSKNDIAFTIMGRQMGWFIVLAWCGYGAVFANVFYKVFDKKLGAKTIWITVAIAAIAEIVLEEVITAFDIYVYYGNQPLVLIHNLPWWWIPCNVGGVFLAACIAYYFKDILTGARAFLFIIVVPCAMGASYALVALPSWIAVNGEYSSIITQLAGILTLILSFMVFSMEMNIFLKINPFDLKKKNYSINHQLDEIK
ncbi:hypothetical protein LL037_21850 [Clostridium estertheticum]|uniref:hypothetical protein n=1 Tax=Clostridium estertheticum TaxID=238834 RepID=UPI001C0E1F43|nr:hypothetical protein [Clostridium estertheticum]MBU3198388.1 hypothetical protein [Clostridium estertheticum]WAG65071.1 hypothetical protein LL037_21850 [Clostridium estertheticum]